VAPELISAGRCGPKLQLMWLRMDARPASCLDLELVCGGFRSLGSPMGVNPHVSTKKVKLLLNINHLEPQAVKTQRHHGDNDLE
jgi:hypothetical protein